jgi:hypothetical protein
MRALVAVLALLVSAQAFGEFSPPDPTAYDFIRYETVFGGECGWEGTAVRNGSQITITFQGGAVCLAVPSAQSVDIGFLPAGTYDVTVYTDQGSGPELYETATLVVAPAIRVAVPTLDARAMALLLAALSVAGLFVMRRQM